MVYVWMCVYVCVCTLVRCREGGEGRRGCWSAGCGVVNAWRCLAHSTFPPGTAAQGRWGRQWVYGPFRQQRQGGSSRDDGQAEAAGSGLQGRQVDFLLLREEEVTMMVMSCCWELAELTTGVECGECSCEGR